MSGLQPWIWIANVDARTNFLHRDASHSTSSLGETLSSVADALLPPTSNGVGIIEDQADERPLTDELIPAPLPNVETGAIVTSSDPLASPALSAVTLSLTESAAVDSTLKDLTPQPVTSDLRQETQPVTEQAAAVIKEQKHLLDLQRDPQLANGLAHSDNDPIERTTDLPSVEVGDHEKMDTSMAVDPTPESMTAELPHHPAVPVVDGNLPEAPVDPAPSPALLQPQPFGNDQEMQDAPPASPGKIARSRDDEDMDAGRATKRSRTDDDGSAVPEFKVPELPPLNTTENGTQPEGLRVDGSQAITKTQHKFLLKAVQNTRRTKDAGPFSAPVDFVALNIPSYPNIITKPMDLKTMEEKLKDGRYTSVDAYVADFNQIVENAATFNGQEHPVTALARKIKEAFDKQLSNLPGPDVPESSPADKKAKKAAVAPAAKAVVPRRESRSSLGGSARSPTAVAAVSPQTFALGPQGVPLIRRDSTTGDGRPKREIHPPPPRDLPYANQKPKKKKYQWELKFCQEVMNEMNKPKYQVIGYPFYNPVDPVALNIPHYHKLIKRPMDLGTISSKLKGGQYENAKEFEGDIRLMFQNCYKFNPANDPVNGMGHQFEGVFDEKWSEKRHWLDDHVPASGPQSPGSSPEPEEEEEEEEEDDEEEEENQLTILQKQIAAMSKQVEMIQKKKSSPPVSGKKANKGSKPVKKEAKKSSSAAPIKSEKKGSSKPAKKEKAPYVTYEQKQDISNRINSLPESKMATALKIIRDNMPNLKVRFGILIYDTILHYLIHWHQINTDQGVQEDEIELDIDELSNEVLFKLLGFVRKYAPRPDDSPPPRQQPIAPSTAAPSRPKKNKPMSKTEQEARISEINGRLAQFQNPAPGTLRLSVSRFSPVHLLFYI